MVKVESAAAQKQLMKRVQIHLFLLLFVSTQTVLGGNIVKYLPGYDGELPFKLETGYISVDDSELFYYFVESEGNPEADPLFLWLSGGPGCTSFNGLVYEIGPLEYDVENYSGGFPKLRYYPYARTKWLIEHPEYLSVQLFIGGDSYAGLNVPLITKLIIEGNNKKQEPYVNIKGYLAGAPLTDKFIDQNSFVEFAHRLALISDEIYESAKMGCNGDYVTFDPANTACVAAVGAVQKCVKPLNGKDILKPNCDLSFPNERENMYHRSLEEGTRESLVSEPCAPENDISFKLNIWGNDERVREALHVRKGTKGQLTRCNRSLVYTEDVLSVVDVHKELSQMDLKVLVESGDHDMAISYVGTLKWIKSLNLSVADDWRPWFVDNQVAGYTTQYSDKNGYRLTFATVKGAGHPALEYHRKECYYLFDRRIHDRPV